MVGFRRTQYIPRFGGVLQGSGILLGGCLTCEELVGGYSQEMMGLVLGEPNIYHQLVDFSIMGDLNRKVVIK